MNSKRKLISSVFTLISLVLVALVAISLPAVLQTAQNKAMAQSINAYGVAANVEGNYYVGGTCKKMLSGESDKIVFEASDQSSSPALSPAGSVALSSKNDFVVFEYIFTNTSDEVSLVASITNVIEAKNMNTTYAYSYTKLTDYSKVGLTTLSSVPLNCGKGETLYLYIKVKVADLNKSSSMDGMFCFNLSAEEVYELNLSQGELQTKTYAALGFKLASVEVPKLQGMNFEGYYTAPNGRGEQIFDENGNSNLIWSQTSGDTLYAHFTQV